MSPWLIPSFALFCIFQFQFQYQIMKRGVLQISSPVMIFMFVQDGLIPGGPKPSGCDRDCACTRLPLYRISRVACLVESLVLVSGRRLRKEKKRSPSHGNAHNGVALWRSNGDPDSLRYQILCQVDDELSGVRRLKPTTWAHWETHPSDHNNSPYNTKLTIVALYGQTSRDCALFISSYHSNSMSHYSPQRLCTRTYYFVL